MADLAGLREALEQRGVRGVIVHMGSVAEGKAFLGERGAGEYLAVSDPDARLYAEFGLGRAGAPQLLNPRVLARGYETWRQGHRVARPVGDTRQMAGAFVLRDGAVIGEHRCRDVADRPDYLALIDASLNDLIS